MRKRRIRPKPLLKIKSRALKMRDEVLRMADEDPEELIVKCGQAAGKISSIARSIRSNPKAGLGAAAVFLLQMAAKK